MQSARNSCFLISYNASLVTTRGHQEHISRACNMGAARVGQPLLAERAGTMAEFKEGHIENEECA